MVVFFLIPRCVRGRLQLESAKKSTPAIVAVAGVVAVVIIMAVVAYAVASIVKIVPAFGDRSAKRQVLHQRRHVIGTLYRFCGDLGEKLSF